jgi:hypothetical protein
LLAFNDGAGTVVTTRFLIWTLSSISGRVAGAVSSWSQFKRLCQGITTLLAPQRLPWSVVRDRQQLLQSRLAADQRQAAQILAAFEQQIESEIDERIGLSFGKGDWRAAKSGASFSSRAHYLAINNH